MINTPFLANPSSSPASGRLKLPAGTSWITIGAASENAEFPVAGTITK